MAIEDENNKRLAEADARVRDARADLEKATEHSIEAFERLIEAQKRNDKRLEAFEHDVHKAHKDVARAYLALDELEQIRLKAVPAICLLRAIGAAAADRRL